MRETIFEKSQTDQHAYSIPKEASEWQNIAPPKELLRKNPLPLPEVSELDLLRHFVELSSRNVGIDNLFYPLGSCTMKLNPRINEQVAALPGFTRTHPFAPDATVQGNLYVLNALATFLMELTGMQNATFVPNAGAQGELIGVKLIAAYHQSRKDSARSEFLVPDSAHGTNPASVAMSGFIVRPVKTDRFGDLDIEALESALSERTAGLMLTNPNTLGLFSSKIDQITDLVHRSGGLCYCDGANLNPILTIAKPAEMGFDVMHINLHKTFSTPHGGGGPGGGPVLCNHLLAPFMPLPRIEKKGAQFAVIWQGDSSIGRIATFHGNFGICLRAYAYILLNGLFGLRRVAKGAVANANYLKKCLEDLFTVPFPQVCMHEFVLQMDKFLEKGVKAGDIAKRLLDYGVHAPTVYFPLIVKECFLIEPTETESKKTLDGFVSAMKAINAEIDQNPEIVKMAPHSTPVRRLDEVGAARNPVVIDPKVLKNLSMCGTSPSD